MRKSIEVTGKTEEEALASALAQLGLDRDEVSVEILQRAKSGFLGIGSAPAVLKVFYEAPEAAPEPAAAPAAPAKAPKAEAAPAPEAPQGEPVEPGSQEEKVVNFLSGLLTHMGVKASIQIHHRENGGITANLSGNGMGAVIGRRGETLDAIQHLTNYAVNRGADKRMHISVDAENYRSKREESLVRLAEKMAAKVVKYRRSMALEPMNSYERHVIHTALQNYEGVTTSSTGTEPNRRVVVSYVRPESGDNSSKPQIREWS